MKTLNKDGRKFTVSPEEAGGKWRIRTFLVTLVILVVILLIFFAFAVHTEMFRVWAEEYLSDKMGMSISVAKTRLGPPYCLVLEGVDSAPDLQAELASFSAREIRVALGLDMRLRLKVSDCKLSMLKLEDGTWRPVFFSRLGTVREVDQIAATTEEFRKRIRLNIARSSILWFDADGSRMARAEYLDFRMDPVVLRGDRRLYECSLSVYDLVREDGSREQNVREEWLFTEDNRLMRAEERTLNVEREGKLDEGAVDAADTGAAKLK
ncbi:MAG: hypothetical protein E4H02_07445 [Lentisphaerales bacterium]|jgi:hypothetical protein|nr:MAG: hypothetical protein E4H02_07445 [Lentisphaerales bacterium]